MNQWHKKSEFAEFEREFGLFDREYNGFPYWQSIRFGVCQAVYGEAYEEPSRRQTARLRGRMQKLRAAARGLIGMARQGECKVLCVLHTPRVWKFYDAWDFPPGISVGYLESCAERVDLSAMRPSTLTFQLGAFLRKRAHVGGGGVRDLDEAAFLTKLELAMAQRFGRTVAAGVLEEMIVDNLYLSEVAEAYFRRLFEKTRCKALVVVCYYQEPLYPAYKVAKEMGVKVVELQHGVIFDHQSYWFEDLRGVNNYTPDYFLSFGRAHTDGAKMLPTTEQVAVGFPFQERELAEHSGQAPEEKRVIIYPHPEEDFDKQVADFARRAVAAGYSVLVKLHPLESQIYPSLYPLTCGVAGVEFVADQSRSIYFWLSSARHHVMANTTVGLEAVCFPDINIYIATFVKHEQLESLLDAGDAVGFGSGEELMEAVSRNDEPFRSGLREALWERGAKENLERFFSDMRQGGWA